MPDRLRRDFTAAALNQRYVGDITYLPLADGSNLYLATVIDCFSRRLTQPMGVVGTSADNALAETFNASLKRETLQGAHGLVTPLIGQTLDDRASPKAGEPRVGMPIAAADTVERRAGRSIRCGNGGHRAGARRGDQRPTHAAASRSCATASAH